MFVHADFLTLVLSFSIVGTIGISALLPRVEDYSRPVRIVMLFATIAASCALCLFLFSSKLGGLAHLAEQAGRGSAEGMYRGYKMTIGEAPF